MIKFKYRHCIVKLLWSKECIVSFRMFFVSFRMFAYMEKKMIIEGGGGVKKNEFWWFYTPLDNTKMPILKGGVAN